MKRYFEILILVMIFSCNVMGISDLERNGINKVVETYGGSCKYLKDYEVTNSPLSKNYFELEVSNSKVINTLFENPEIPASGVAFTFFNELKADRRKYEFIKVVVENNDGLKYASQYSIKELEMIQSQFYIIERLINLINKSDNSAIIELLKNQSLISYNKSELLENVMKTNKEFGRIKSFTLLGYVEYKSQKGDEFLHLSGQLLREKVNHFFSIDIDKRDNSILLFNYKV